ncbi:peptide-methionine (S)-S-oxide reductase MsrA [uncultured Bacteroides sp.]|uniref:peptide-methionine (S)-S-oxide reductase MsrA n=1 Tax=uncultured Bacteroides sp. TaxID=162156 RepID=UPI002AA880E8|nr:peptide-methionine (S)-S-oxide reductase MsrA [uncultured Bacteroides sp.]
MEKNIETSTAYFASGCFWGTEYHFMKQKGVISTAVGFMGGSEEYPTYPEVKTGTTGHLETVEVVYNPVEVSYGDLVKLFFETHDFTQTDGQGPDIGSQYLSAIFYLSEEQLLISQKYIAILQAKGYDIATSLRSAGHFWLAEDYHQQYYEHKGTTPYCHIYRKIF